MRLIDGWGSIIPRIHSSDMQTILWCTVRVKQKLEKLRQAIKERLAHCKLELHPEKTKIVYCKGGRRKGSYPNEKFDFLGYTFRVRGSMNRNGEHFISFSPAVSEKAMKSMRQTVKSWRIHRRSGATIDELSRQFDPVIRGWIRYYGNYYKSALYVLADYVNLKLVKWAMRKYKKLRISSQKAWLWLRKIANQNPKLFAHWRLRTQFTA